MAQGLGSLSSGFMQGFGMMSDHQNQQRRMEMEQEDRKWRRQRQADQAKREEALFDKKMDTYEQEQEANKLRGGLHALERGGNVDPSEFEPLRGDDQLRSTFREVTGADPDNYFDPDRREKLETAVGKVEGVLSGQDARSPREVMSDPDVTDAANVILEDRVKKGIGEEAWHDGRRVTVEDKRIADIVPGPDGKSVMFELEVEGTDENGEKVNYRAPMTHMRSASPEDDEALPVDVDTLGKRIIGHRQMLNATKDNPQIREQLQSALEEQIVRRGGEVGPASEWDKLDDRTLYNPATGETKDVGGGMPGGGAATEDGDWRIPVVTDQGETAKTFTDSDLRNHYRTEFNIPSESEVQNLRTQAMMAQGEQKQQYEQMVNEAVRRRAEAPTYNEWISRVQSNGLDLRSGSGQSREGNQPQGGGQQPRGDGGQQERPEREQGGAISDAGASDEPFTQKAASMGGDLVMNGLAGLVGLPGAGDLARWATGGGEESIGNGGGQEEQRDSGGQQPRQGGEQAPRQSGERQQEISPELVERARRDPNAYAQVLRQQNPDASDDAIRRRVRQKFPEAR